MRCESCGAENVDANAFCGACGCRIMPEATAIPAGPPDLPPTSWWYWDNGSARTRRGAVERVFWRSLGLPPGGWSLRRFTCYVALVMLAALVVLILWLGPLQPLLLLFIGIMMVSHALILYWVYFTHPARD